MQEKNNHEHSRLPHNQLSSEDRRSSPATVRLADRSETLGCEGMEVNLCPKKLVHRNLVMDIFSLECARPKCSEVVPKSDMLA
jgi:hypothetical protein